jgi:hypothetical protein
VRLAVVGEGAASAALLHARHGARRAARLAGEREREFHQDEEAAQSEQETRHGHGKSEECMRE